MQRKQQVTGGCSSPAEGGGTGGNMKTFICAIRFIHLCFLPREPFFRKQLKKSVRSCLEKRMCRGGGGGFRGKCGENYDSFACFMETITGANAMCLRWRKSCNRKTGNGC